MTTWLIYPLPPGRGLRCVINGQVIFESNAVTAVRPGSL